MYNKFTHLYNNYFKKYIKGGMGLNHQVL